MKFINLFLLLAALCGQAFAGSFVYDPAVNAQLAKKLDVPAYFTFPASAFLADPVPAGSLDNLYEFRHPASAAAANTVGLHIYSTHRQGAARRLASSGLVQSGDVLLTVRPEWGYRGPYPNVQMGVSHAGLAFVADGQVTDLDNPLNEEYLGRLDASHYLEAKAIHIVRPRGLTQAQRANLRNWGKLIFRRAREIYPAQLAFNQNYFEPKYSSDRDFAVTLARIALGTDKAAKIDLYCSEFVWALLSLKDCDPASPEAFAGAGRPACVKDAFQPLAMTGDFFTGGSRYGLSDGPLAVIAAMGLPAEDKARMVREVFETKRPLDSMSPGHRAVAEKLAPFFAPLEKYYAGIEAGSPEAVQTAGSFNSGMKPNYSPTSYVINALLPDGSPERKFDIVATVVFAQ